MELILRHLSKAQLNKIIEKCQGSEDFKQSLIRQPQRTLRSVLGITLDLPENAQLVINDQTDARFVHLNIPPQMEYDDVELTEAELDFVSGGTGGTKKVDD